MESLTTTYRHHEVGMSKSVVTDSDSKKCTLISDEAILQRVLGNLLKNALEATDDGGTVKLGTETKEKYVIRWCWNAGCVPSASQLQIFQRRFTAKGIGHGIGTYSGNSSQSATLEERSPSPPLRNLEHGSKSKCPLMGQTLMEAPP